MYVDVMRKLILSLSFSNLIGLYAANRTNQSIALYQALSFPREGTAAGVWSNFIARTSEKMNTDICNWSGESP